MLPLTTPRSHLVTSGVLPQAQPTAEHRGPGLATPEPTSQPQVRVAARQPDTSPGIERHLSLPPPTSAEAAAEAARRAYIDASIAAGVNPLPLPGR